MFRFTLKEASITKKKKNEKNTFYHFVDWDFFLLNLTPNGYTVRYIKFSRHFSNYLPTCELHMLFFVLKNIAGISH